MAIPVENPPPRYAPPARKAAGEEPNDLFLRAPARGRVLRVQVGRRGCAVAAGIALGLVLAAGGVGTWLFTNVALVEAPRRIVTDLRSVAHDQDRASEVEDRLVAFSSIVENQRLGLTAAAVLFNRFNAAKADTRITPDELDSIMVLIDDILAGDGTIDIERYPLGR